MERLRAMLRDPKRRKVVIAAGAGIVLALVIILTRRNNQPAAGTTTVVGGPPQGGAIDGVDWGVAPDLSGGGGGLVGTPDPGIPAEPTITVIQPEAPSWLERIGDVLLPETSQATSPAPAALAPATPAAPTGGASSSGSRPDIVWHGRSRPNLATLQAANPGERLEVRERGGNQGFVVVSTGPAPGAAAPPPAPAAAAPTPAPAPARAATPAGPAAGTVVWHGASSPNLATLRERYPGRRLDVRRPGGGGYAVVVL